MSDAEKKENMKKVNGIFEMRLKNKEGKEQIWTIDLKKVNSSATFLSILQEENWILVLDYRMRKCTKETLSPRLMVSCSFEEEFAPISQEGR